MAFDPSNPNLNLWLANEKSDPAFTKPITGKQYSGTSLNPTYVVKRLTEAFGPVGWGWGFEVLRFDEVQAPAERWTSFCHIRFWYFPHGRAAEVDNRALQSADPREIGGCAWFEQIGGTDFAGKRKSGAEFADEDVRKKSLTDALTKAASYIGIGGDIFLGRFDDSKYVEARKREEAADKQAAGLGEQKALHDECTTLVRQLGEQDTALAVQEYRAKALALKGRLEAAGLSDEIDQLGEAVRAAVKRVAPKKEAA